MNHADEPSEWAAECFNLFNEEPFSIVIVLGPHILREVFILPDSIFVSFEPVSLVFMLLP